MSIFSILTSNPSCRYENPEIYKVLGLWASLGLWGSGNVLRVQEKEITLNP